MPKSKHSEASILATLKQLDAGRSVADVAREVRVSQPRFKKLSTCAMRTHDCGSSGEPEPG